MIEKPINIINIKGIGIGNDTIPRQNNPLDDSLSSLQTNNIDPQLANKNLSDEKERNKIEQSANSIFDGLNLGLAMKFHQKSGEWYAVVENKLTKEIVKEVPPKYILDLHAKLKEMIGFFLDKKI